MMLLLDIKVKVCLWLANSNLTRLCTFLRLAFVYFHLHSSLMRICLSDIVHCWLEPANHIEGYKAMNKFSKMKSRSWVDHKSCKFFFLLSCWGSEGIFTSKNVRISRDDLLVFSFPPFIRTWNSQQINKFLISLVAFNPLNSDSSDSLEVAGKEMGSPSLRRPSKNAVNRAWEICRKPKIHHEILHRADSPRFEIICDKQVHKL